MAKILATANNSVFLFHAFPCTIKIIGNISIAVACIVDNNRIRIINGTYFFLIINPAHANKIATGINCLMPL